MALQRALSVPNCQSVLLEYVHIKINGKPRVKRRAWPAPIPTSAARSNKTGMAARVNSNAFAALECTSSDSGSSSGGSSEDSDAGWTPLPADAASGLTLVGAAPATSSDDEIEAVQYGSEHGRSTNNFS